MLTVPAGMSEPYCKEQYPQSRYVLCYTVQVWKKGRGEYNKPWVATMRVCDGQTGPGGRIGGSSVCLNT